MRVKDISGNISDSDCCNAIRTKPVALNSALAKNRRQEVVGEFIEPGEREGEHKEGDEHSGVGMDERKEQANADPGGFGKTELLDEWKKHAAKNKLLGDGRQHDRKKTEKNLLGQ